MGTLNFSIALCISFYSQHCLGGGGGDECCVQNENMQSVPGLSTNIVANEMVQQCTFPDELKLADVSPVFKSADTTLKTLSSN